MILVGLALPIAAPFTLALLKCAVPKLVRGKTPPTDDEGASAMTSAEEWRVPVRVLWTVCDQPWVVSFSTRV